MKTFGVHVKKPKMPKIGTKTGGKLKGVPAIKSTKAPGMSTHDVLKKYL